MVHTYVVETMAEGNVDGEISLLPFVHQVGGHTRMHLLDPTTICKPLITRELNFYRNIPKDIQRFTPHFKGVIQVCTMDRTNAVHVKSVSSPKVCYLDPETVDSKKNKRASGLRVKICTEGSWMTTKYNSEPSPSRCFEDFRFKNSKQSNVQSFLLLENIASHFFRPCILDLKMGTRQHGDDAPEEKRHRHMAKCAASTSASLGVRLCGMQVYQADMDATLFKDKYYGRLLDEEGFKHSLYEFFHNGFKLRVRVINQVLERLRHLRKAVEKQNSFRFFSSSLLILYEGRDTKDLNQCDESYSDSESEGAGGNEATAEHKCDLSSDGEMSDTQLESSTETDDSSNARSSPKESEDDCRSQVDVRMIDFAHTTYEGYVGDSHIHRGPDKGYLLGLDNLTKLLVEIISEEDEGGSGRNKLNILYL